MVPVGAAPVLHREGVAVGGSRGYRPEGVAVHPPVDVQPMPVYGGLLVEIVGELCG